MIDIVHCMVHRHDKCVAKPAVDKELRHFLTRVRGLITDTVLSLGSFLCSPYQECLAKHFAGGKLVRTQAMFLLARCVGRTDIDRLACNATALELVHRSSLLVDDLVDRSPSRNDTQAACLGLGPAKTTFISHIFTAKGACLCSGVLGQDLLHACEQLNLGQLAEQIYPYNVSSAETLLRNYIKVVSLKSGSLGVFALLSAVKDQDFSYASELGVEDVAHDLAVTYQIANDLDDLASWIQSDTEETPKDVTNGSPSLPLLLAWQLAAKDGVRPHDVRLAWKGREDFLRRLLRDSDIIPRCRNHIDKTLEAVVARVSSLWPMNAYSQLFLVLSTSEWLQSYLGTYRDDASREVNGTS